MDRFNTPILFIIFNRPDTTSKVFDEIKRIRPGKLFIAADGPRKNNAEDIKNCKLSRSIVAKIDWECKIERHYSEINLGCKTRVSSAIDWFFNQVEEGIILEDDCLPDQSFFKFCEILLEYYRDDKRIMMISGDNFQFGKKRGEASYYFSIYTHIWGWATWRRAWGKFDIEMKTYPKFLRENMIKKIFSRSTEQTYWLDIFNKMFYKKIDTWDYIWTYTCWYNKGFACIPNKNLVINIGFRQDATHTKIITPNLNQIKLENIELPLIHPNNIILNSKADGYVFDYVLLPNKKILTFLLKKIYLMLISLKYKTNKKYDQVYERIKKIF